MKFIYTDELDKNNDIRSVLYTDDKKEKNRILSPRVSFHSTSVTNFATLFSRKN